MNLSELRNELGKQERKYLYRYIQILKLHIKEELTNEEKDELNALRNNGKLLNDKIKEAKKEHNNYIHELSTAKFVQDKSIECSLCHENKNHEIIDCPMNCCGTSNGECLR
jgi:hypothetical protein